MKSKQKFKLPTKNTILIIYQGIFGDDFEYSNEKKLKELGIAYADAYESGIENACRIDLSENMDISQDTWDALMDHLKTQKATFQINSRFV